MKRFFLILLVFGLSFPAVFADDTVKRNKFQKAVDVQHESDQKRKDELLAKMKGIIGSYSKRLKQSGIKDASLDLPIDPNRIDDINDMERHTDKPVPPAVFAFVLENTNLFSGSSAVEVVGRAGFAEKVELLEKTAKPVLYKGSEGNWLLIRKGNGDEGWLHSSLLSVAKPSKLHQQPPAETEDGGSAFNVPVSGTRTSNFGSRVDPVTHKQNAFHSGIDIAAPLGTPVSAAADGTVARAEFNKNGYGNLIVIEHQKDFSTYYGHLSVIKVMVGQKVKKGDNLGAVGSTGKSTGPHLHFEVRRGDKALDPDSFLK